MSVSDDNERLVLDPPPNWLARKVQAMKECEALAGRFAELNRTPGVPPINPPGDIDRMAHLNAITVVLLEAGICTKEQFEAHKAEAVLGLLEQSLEQARSLKRQFIAGKAAPNN